MDVLQGGGSMPSMQSLVLDFSRAAYVVRALRDLAARYDVPSDTLTLLANDACRILEQCALDDIESSLNYTPVIKG